MSLDWQLTLGTLLICSVWTSVETAELIQNFSCCHLPTEIDLNRNNEHEFYIKNQTLAVVTASYCAAKPPFTFLGNISLTMDKCEDFYQKTIFTNKRGFTEEKITHHLSEPCNRTDPSIQPQGVIVSAVLGVLSLGVIVGLTLCLYKKTNCCKKTDNGVV